MKFGANRQMEITKMSRMNFWVPPPACPANKLMAAPAMPSAPKVIGKGSGHLIRQGIQELHPWPFNPGNTVSTDGTGKSRTADAGKQDAHRYRCPKRVLLDDFFTVHLFCLLMHSHA
jgi:hypothetical protein